LVALVSAVEIHPWSLSETAHGLLNLVSHRSRSRSSHHAFLKNLDYTLKLRICNAYTGGEPFDVYRNEVEIHKSLEYKACFESTDDLRSGDRVNFKVKGLSTGSFTIDQLPTEDAVLMLVIKRRDMASLATSFASHVFANLQSPQVAIMDAYKGKDNTVVQLKNEEDNKLASVSYDSVVAIDEGSYQAKLKDNKKEYGFEAVQRECYTVLRLGMDGKNPADLVVFPTSGTVSTEKESEEKSFSMKAVPSMVAFLAILAAVFA